MSRMLDTLLIVGTILKGIAVVYILVCLIDIMIILK